MPEVHGENCPDCRKLMEPFPVASMPESSEWYCRGCHRTVKMTMDDALVFLRAEARQRMATAQARGGQ